MIPSFLITFRETFEAALVIGIMLGYLTKTDNGPYRKYVFAGTLGGIALSILAAIAFSMVAGGFAGANEQIFEGTTMIVASFLVTTMIVWMAGQQNMGERIRRKVKGDIDKKYGIGIALFSLFSVFREGVEIVLFLNAAAFSAGSSSAFGASAGVIGALGISYLFFKAIVKLNLRHFFLITGTMLTLVAAGLFAHGLHEFQEAGIIPFLSTEAWNTKIFLDDKSALGSMARSIFGYNDNPTHLEVLGYIAFLAGVAFFWNRESKMK